MEPVTNAPRCMIPFQLMIWLPHVIATASDTEVVFVLVFVPKRSPVWAYRSSFVGADVGSIYHYRLSATVMTMGSGGVFFRRILSTDCVLFVTYEYRVSSLAIQFKLIDKPIPKLTINSTSPAPLLYLPHAHSNLVHLSLQMPPPSIAESPKEMKGEVITASTSLWSSSWCFFFP